jgi:hypothetical protein
MYQKSGNFIAFADKGLARRRVFDHRAIVIPKQYPDSQLFLETRGVQRELLQRGKFCQLNLYTTDFHDLPDKLFIDPEVNWHRQQLGRKGLIAAAGLWIFDSTATISFLQSDLCQQLYRHSELRCYKTKVETHFKYWYAILFNAVLDLCLDSNISIVRSPTGNQVVCNTQKTIKPELFLRIYDYPEKHFRCRKVFVGPAQYWEIPVQENISRIARLIADSTIRSRVAKPQICIFHDIEENIDTPISSSICADNVVHMLDIERRRDLNATYNVLGTLFQHKRDEIKTSNSNHSIGFHSFNHNLDDLTQLSKCRAVDLRVRGYRPPQSVITSELTDYNLTRLNFEWLASDASSLSHDDCRLQNGIVKIPIHLDDYPLSVNEIGYEQWENKILSIARSKPMFGLGLHDCYAEKWLKHYPSLLDKLAQIGDFSSADEVCDRIMLDGPSASLPVGVAATTPKPRAKTARLFARMAARFSSLLGTPLSE